MLKNTGPVHETVVISDRINTLINFLFLCHVISRALSNMLMYDKAIKFPRVTQEHKLLTGSVK